MVKRLYQKEYDEFVKTNEGISYNVFVKRLTDRKRYWNKKRKLRKEEEAKQKQERVRRVQERLKTFEKPPREKPARRWYDGIVRFFTDLF